MRLTHLTLVSLAVFASACGGGRVAQVPDSGTPLPQGKCLDSDGDGIPGTGDCSGEPIVDCNDQDPNVYPGQSETCNGVDDNCNGQIDEGLPVIAYYSDLDKDGYGASRVGQGCGAPPAGDVTQSGDCNDNDPSIHPGAAELCNGVDDNCNGQIDEGLPFQSFYVDADHDGYGDPNSTPVQSCQTTVSGRAPNNADCDDTNPSVHPGAPELCNKVDDNCDGQIDNGIAYTSYYPDVDNDGFGAASAVAETACAPVSGKVTNNADCDDTKASIHPGATEVCNGLDDNCDGRIDENLTFSNYYVDIDGDGFGAAGSQALSSCAPVAGRVSNNLDCDDSAAAVHPGATEVCNGKDDDCNGLIDDGLTFSNYYPDADGDGYGSSIATPQNSCSPIAGKVTNNSDCDDTKASVHPGATEVCNGIDDNCNGGIDEGLPTQNYYVDADKDGHGAKNSTPIASCAPVAGRVTNNDDCDDAVATTYTGAPELCNGIDDNCNGLIDDGVVTQSYYTDSDGDGYGANVTAQLSCSPIAGKVTNNTDCDDTKAAVHPGAAEICNGADDNCNGQIDEGLPTSSFYTDADGDGYGATSSAATVSCQSALPGKAKNNTDCDDTKPLVHPGATELCNAIDDNCNGQVDENNPGGGAACTTGQQGVCSAGTMTCTAGSVVCVRNVGPTTEICDNLDNDCNGQVDETFTTKGAACTAGLGVCARTGTNVCTADHTAVTCNATPGSPTAAACDGLDNDCDGIVDEPVLTQTTDVTTTAWQDIEVQPYYFTSGSCNGGTSGTGSDALAGGAMIMAGGTSGISFQRLDTTGKPSGAVASFSGLTYSDVAFAQAGNGYLVAGVWAINNAEIDLYYVDAATGAQRTYLYTQFKVSDGAGGYKTLDSLRVVRGNGRRAVVAWRENGTGIKIAQVEACYNATASTWSIGPAGCGAGGLVTSTVAAGATIAPGLGADSAFPDWVAMQSPCNNPAYSRLLGLAYRSDAQTIKHFTVYENGSGATTPVQVYSVASPRALTEPEVTYFYDATNSSQWAVAYVTQDPGSTPPRADLDFWMTNDQTWHFAYLAYATQNGATSIARPRLSATSTTLWFSALRWITDASGFTEQVMTRTTDLLGNKLPSSFAVELSATSGACGTDPNCRPGNKSGFTTWAPFGRAYYGAGGSTPAGTSSSVLTCN